MKLGPNGESGRDAIRRILSEHPQGLPTAQIFAELTSSGFPKINQNYVSQDAIHDSGIVRVERGVYRLKKVRLSSGLTAAAGTAVVKEAVEEASAINLPRETLLLRIDHLETQNRALQDAHQALLRGMIA